MKLKHFEQKTGYQFKFLFENNEIKEVDLQELIGKYVDMPALKTARVNFEWGCLEFQNGNIDIDPKTLYSYCSQPQNFGKTN